MARWGNSTRTRYTTVVFLALACVLTLARRSSAGWGWPSAVTAIERELSSEDRARRRNAAKTMTGELPPSAGLRLVTQALSDRDQEVRLLASQAAVTWGFSELAPMVLPWLSSPHVEERRSALALLCVMPSSEHVSALARAALDPDDEVRLLGVRCLGRVPGGDVGAVENALAASLDDSSSEVRAAAVDAAGRLVLVRLSLALAGKLQDPDETVRQKAAVALGVLGREEGASALVLALADPSLAVAAASARSLGELQAATAVPSLVSLLARPGWDELSQAAFLALARIGTPQANSELVAELGRGAPATQLVPALRLAGAEAESALTRCMREETGVHLLKCAQVASELGISEQPLAVRVAEGEIPATAVLSALHRVRSPELVALSLEALVLGSQDEREKWLALLERSLPLPAFASAPLVQALGAQGFSPGQRARLLLLLARGESGGELGTVRAFLGSTQPALRAAAAEAIAALSDQPEEIVALLLAGDVTSSAAVRALVRRESSEMSAALLATLRERGGASNSPLAAALAGRATLSAQAQEDLLQILPSTSGGTRDILLDLIARQAGADAAVVDLFDAGGVSDRRRLLLTRTLGADQPLANQLLERALRDSDPWVRVVAVQGAAQPELLARLAADTTNLMPVRTAALLRLSTLRHQSASVVSTACPSDEGEPLGLRLAGVLAQASSPNCTWQAADLLRRAREPILRWAAARVLRRRSSEAAALRSCSTYEQDVLVARACQGTELVAKAEVGCPADYDCLQTDEAVLRDPARKVRTGVPYVVLAASGQISVGVTDRRGRVTVSPTPESAVLLDARLAL